MRPLLDEAFCHAVIDASLFWTGDDEEKCPALKHLRTMAGYYLWDRAGRPEPVPAVVKHER